jgi:chemotaxis protein MotB
MAKKRPREEHVNHERWLVSYADMITPLMVLFVCSTRWAQTDEGSSKCSDLVAAGVLRPGAARHRSDQPCGSSGESVIPPPVPMAITQELIAMTGQVTPDPRMAATLHEVREALVQVPIPSDTSGSVDVGASREGIVISLAGNMLFDSGKSDLKPRGMTLLDTLAERLKTMPNEIRVEGHTDNIPIATPLYPSNWELSSARATTVGRYLAEHSDIAPQRIIAAGYGEFRPVAPNDSREGRARNRRVDLVVLFPQVPGGTGATQAAGGPGTTDQRVASRGTQP